MPVIESDWPTEIALEVVSPLTYLKTQASALSQLTKGVIEAKVATTIDEENAFYCSHVLSIYAAALEDAEIELLRVGHEIDLMYPCHLYSKATSKDGSLSQKFDTRIGSFKELRNIMREVLRSAETVGRIQSLIARVNDTTSQYS